MPLSAIGSYVPTMQEFINHWTQVNAELGAPNPLLLQGGYPIATLITDRAVLEAAIIALQPAENTQSNTASDRDIKKNALRVRLTQFRGLVQGQLYGSIYVRSLPTLPQFSAAESKYLTPFDDMANLWSQINTAPPAGFAGPLLLPGGYTLANFQTDLAALRTSYVAANNAAQNARIARERRDVLLPNVRLRLTQYRRTVVGRLAPTSALLASIPALTPLPGSTPDPVSVSGTWDATLSKGVLTWTASTAPDLASYSVRTSPGPTYRARDETVVASVAKTETTFATSSGLAAPGSTALFKVYVLTTSSNEKGSAVVKITRP